MKSIIDINDNKYELCPFYFKGDKKLIKKLKKDWKITTSGDIVELCLDKKELLDTLEKYPELVAVGFVENWDRGFREVLVVLSSKGSSVLDKQEFAGYFGGHEDERWNWSYFPYEDIHTEFLVLNCGEYQEVDYVFPFKNEWNNV